MKSAMSMFTVYLMTCLTVSAQKSTINQSGEKKLSWGSTLSLEQNYPNPISPAEKTTIEYHIAFVDEAAIIIYDAQTRKPVHQFKNLKQGAGQVMLSGNQLPKGEYIYALLVNGRLVTKRRMRIVS